ncbi:SDR family NAD(P)-dependent oxidoreductase [Rheinheimera sp. 1928-s]|uniref:SDR family NAD(P)-dependent oxidoreductase n=1 Tax=Rheinheimera sp. 1928-s TaxID=3033803 RepID=UPI0026207F80|nr:SDR family NAD(P)-dependent oxidoreductase [Rheinheimera sp. 1928-s]MDF3124334.1 SDR family NAD(P)-dependent oxidoreductase [Rheinheimera sp. 1928-s]
MPRYCLITGASSGLGRELAIQYADAGWQVIAVARSVNALNELHQKHKSIHALPLDLTDTQLFSAAVDQLSQQIPALDLVILNAGSCDYVDATNLPLDIFDRTLALNFQAQVAAVKLLLPLLQKSEQGTLAVVSSLAHLFPFTKAEAYGASKAALSYFADSLRVDLTDSAVRVCLIEPGFVDTPLTQKNDFKMPFLLQVSDAAGRIRKGLDAQQLRIRFPKRLVFSLHLLNLLPYSLRCKVAAGMRQP